MNILQISAAMILVVAPHLSSAVCTNQPSGLAICGRICPSDIQKFGVFSDDFSACTYPLTNPYPIQMGGGVVTGIQYAWSVAPPITPTVACPHWTLAGNNWIFLVTTVTPPSPLTSAGDTAVWLNEYPNPHSSISRNVTGLTVGNQYRIKYTVWADDGGSNPGTVVTSVNPGLLPGNQWSLPQGQVPIIKEVDFTATASNAELTIAEATVGSSVSPVISRVELACLTQGDPICSPCTGQRLMQVPN